MFVIYILIIAAVFALGRVLYGVAEKKISKTEDKKILKGFLVLRNRHNKGAVMNVASNHTTLVTLFASIVFVAVLVWFAVLLPKKGRVLLKTGLALLIGGAAGNMYERIRYRSVADYFSFCFLKKVIFNVSDIFIIVGSLIAALGY